MSMESAVSSLRYLRRWFNPGMSTASSSILDLNYQGIVTEELIGWKVAYIANWQNVEFKGVSFGGYGIKGKYLCIRKNCVFGSCKRCGFYSYFDFMHARKFFKDRFGTVILQVSHFGTVFVHEKGYRSEEQEVLSVGVSAKCSRFLCNTNSIGLRKTGKLFGSACLKHCEPATDFSNLTKLWGVPVEVIK